MMRSLTTLFVVLLLALSGCATDPSSRHQAAGGVPQPARLSVETTLRIDIPEEVVRDSGVPNKANGHFKLSIEAKAIQADPVRSQFDGEIVLCVTDPNEMTTYIDFATHLEGECDGDPGAGITRAIVQSGRSLGVLLKHVGPMLNAETP